MFATCALTVFALVAGGLLGQTTPPSGATTQKDLLHREQGVLAAESFRHSAVGMICSGSRTPARAGRLVVLGRFADRLVAGEASTSRLLADISLAQADPNGEARALAAYLRSFPSDCDQTLRWVSVRLGQLQTADERAAFLQLVVGRKDLGRPVRAETAAMLARLRNGQGRTPEAVAAARKAIELDPCSPSGLAIWAAVKEPASEVERLDLRLRVLRSDGRSAAEAWEVALQLGGLGLHKEALRFFEHAWPDAEPGKAPAGNVSEQQLLVDYCNALLDAGQHNKAIRILLRGLRGYSRAPGLSALLYEAYRAADRDKEAKVLMDAMASSYKERETGGEISQTFAAETAWFYVTTLPRPNLAIIYGERAVKADANSIVYQRILGAAELAVGRSGPDKGENRLKKLLGKDTYASVFLAERYSIAADKAALEKAVLAAAPLPRSGPAYRRLTALATRGGVRIPPAKGADEARRLVAGFDGSYLEMFRQPARFVAMDLQPVHEKVSCGQPVEVLASLRNVSSVNVPLGRAGLFRPEMALAVVVTGADGKTIASVSRLPMAIWPAPRYLRPGQRIEQRVRLDVAELSEAMAFRPLEDLSLKVVGTLDPTARTAGAGVPVKGPVAGIVRTGLLGSFDRKSNEAWVKAYQLALGRIVRDLRRGTLAQRMRAARQIGCLLAMASRIEAGRVDPPRPLSGRIDKLVMLSMMRAMLQDRSPAVRQEMIVSLHHASLDKTTLSLLAPAIEDASPMVRCRLVELLAASGSKGHKTILNYLAGDRDELVRQMVRAFQRP